MKPIRLERFMSRRNGDRTPLALVCLLFFGGTVAAAQVGKAIVSLPLMRSEMTFGIDVAAAILSVFATLGATCGLGGGALVSWFGARRTLPFGMIGLDVGNGCAVVATGVAPLMVARIIEGAGFFGVVLATPLLTPRVRWPPFSPVRPFRTHQARPTKRRLSGPFRVEPTAPK